MTSQFSVIFHRLPQWRQEGRKDGNTTPLYLYMPTVAGKYIVSLLYTVIYTGYNSFVLMCKHIYTLKANSQFAMLLYELKIQINNCGNQM